MRSRIWFGLLLVFVISGTLLAQDNKYVQVEGTIQDEEGNALASATAVILDPADSTMISFGLANDKGDFLMRRVKPGDYLLQVSYVGLKTLEKTIVVPGAEEQYNLGLLKLQPAALDEVTVTADRIPMMINKDTIIYNAAAFKTQPNDAVEELLRKMPGIEVADDGTITAQGEDVESVLVDGKEFFGDDPTIAIKNLPARAVAKVEVFDRKSDMAEFTGIDDGQETKAINLKLKEDHKKGLFGTVTGGYGTEDRYAGSTTLNLFDKNTQVSFIGMLNNVNRQGFSPRDFIQFSGGMANLLNNSSGGGRPNLGSGGAAISSGLSNGFVETAATGLTLNHEFSRKTKINLSYFYNSIENTIDQVTRRENIGGQQGQFFSNASDHAVTSNLGHRVNTVFDHEIDSSQNLKIRGSLSFNNSARLADGTTMAETLQGMPINQSRQNNELTGANSSYQGALVYRKKFAHKGRSFSGSVNLRSQSNDQTALIESLQRFASRRDQPVLQDSLLQDQVQINTAQRYGWTLNYLEPIGKNKYLGLEYTRSNDANELRRDVYDLLDEGELIDELTNRYNQDYLYDRAGLSLRWLKGKSNLSANFNMQRSTLEGEIITSESQISQKYINFVPRLRWDFDIASAKRLSFNYSTNVNEPSLTQLQPIADNSNPLNIYIGNPDLRPSYAHRAQLRYFSFSQFSLTNFFANVSGTYTNNAIVNSRTIDSLFRQVTIPINVDNNYRLSSYIGFGTPIKAIGFRINSNLNYSYTRSIVSINRQQDISRRNNSSLELSFDNLQKDVVDLRLGTRFGINRTSYDEGAGQNQEYFNQNHFVDINISPNSRWNIGSRFNYRIYSGGTRAGDVQAIPLWEASLSAFVMRRKGEIKLSAFDILNRNEGIEQNVDINYIEDVRINSLGQYFMVSFTYAINQLVERRDNNQRGGSMRMMRGGRR